ncbi:MAG: HNH endonuclease signature motif containing protein [Acidobacteriota bacterium]
MRLRVLPLVRFVILVLTLAAASPSALPIQQSVLLAKSGSSQKTVHVKEYRKKDGTVVRAHDRKPPKSKGSSVSAPAKAEPAPKPLTEKQRLKAAEDYLKRSDAARHAFMKQTGYPKGRPGYIIDHIIPLACHGPDDPSNMQWQTVEEAKAKDKIERKGC